MVMMPHTFFNLYRKRYLLIFTDMYSDCYGVGGREENWPILTFGNFTKGGVGGEEAAGFADNFIVVL